MEDCQKGSGWALSIWRVKTYLDILCFFLEALMNIHDYDPVWCVHQGIRVLTHRLYCILVMFHYCFFPKIEGWSLSGVTGMKVKGQTCQLGVQYTLMYTVWKRYCSSVAQPPTSEGSSFQSYSILQDCNWRTASLAAGRKNHGRLVQELDYGPNGGLVFAMEYLSENMNWLEALSLFSLIGWPPPKPSTIFSKWGEFWNPQSPVVLFLEFPIL